MKPALSILIPFYNEEVCMYDLTASIEKFCRQHQNINWEIVFIDDGSEDQSCIFLRKNSIRSAACKLIRLSRNFGSHAALKAGINHASGDWITFLYADLQDPLELVTRMHERCEQGYDIVWAERLTTSSKYSETLFSRMYARLMRYFVTPDYPEKGFDVVIFSRKVGNCIKKNEESNTSVFIEILTTGFRQTRITYDKQARKAGKSKWTLSKKIKLFIDSFVAFSYAPIRLVSLVGIAMFIGGLGWSLYLISYEIFIGGLRMGWPTMMSVLLIGFGITNISLGIIAEYLWRTFDAARGRSAYIVDEIIEL